MFKVWSAEITNELADRVGDEGLNELTERLEDTLDEWIKEVSKSSAGLG